MLQITAIITMLIDHIGIIVDSDIMRCIGRLSMPIYSYFLIRYIITHKDLTKYKRNLLYLACVSQIPFTLFVYEKYGFYFNCCCTWYICTVFIDNILYHRGNYKRVLLSIFLLACFVIVPLDYGIICLLWCLIWYFVHIKQYTGAVALSLPLVVLYIAIGDMCQIWAFCAVPVVLLCVKYNKLYLPKKYKFIYHWFYPFHLGVLACLR